MLHNVVLVSAVQQNESAIRIHISPYLLPLASPSLPPFLPSFLYLFFCNNFEYPTGGRDSSSLRFSNMSKSADGGNSCIKRKDTHDAYQAAAAAIQPNL